MAVRLTPHIMSVIDWKNPLDDPIRRQFVPLKSTFVKDHPALELDSLHETDDSPVPGLVHRYPEKVLFLGEQHIVLYTTDHTDTRQPRQYAQSIAGSAHARMRWAVIPTP